MRSGGSYLQVPVEGTKGRGALFGVWVVERLREGDATAEDKGRAEQRNVRLTVRDGGKWTEEYAEIMKNMGIPTVDVKDSPLRQQPT